MAIAPPAWMRATASFGQERNGLRWPHPLINAAHKKIQAIFVRCNMSRFGTLPAKRNQGLNREVTRPA
jgi:hypothetical protein